MSAFFEGKNPSSEFIEEKTLRRRRRLAHYLYNALFALAFSLVLTYPGPRVSPVPALRTGDIADYDVLAPLTIDIQPRETTAPEREDLARRVAPVFDFDESALDVWLQTWKDTFKKIREEYYSGKPRADSGHEPLSARIAELTGQTLSARDVIFLHQNRFGADIEQIFVKAAQPLLGRLIAPSDLFPSYYSTGIVVRQVNQALNETLIHDVSRIWSLEHAREFLRQIPRPGKGRKESEKVARTVEILSAVIVPNLKFNMGATQKRIAAVLGNNKQPVYSVKKGQAVVRRGERLTEQQAQLLNNLRNLMSKESLTKRFLWLSLALFVFLSVVFRLDVTKKGFWKLTLKDALVFKTLVLLELICVKYAIPYVRLLFPASGGAGVEYLLPIATGGIMVHLTMGKEAAYSFALVVAMGVGYVAERSFFLAIWTFTVMVSAIQSIRSCKQRTDLYRCGAWSGTVGALLVLAFSVTQSMGFSRFDFAATAVPVGMAFLSGMLSATLTSSLIPILEALFGYTTSLKLLELSNFNHPLLHSLMMKAPGTYHHSVIVGSLAEIAADRIKASSLLARVAAYYHDIGKMLKPLYFIENQSVGNNPHDHLKPSMSAKILFSHVKNGVRLGKEHQLGKKIIDVIEQHHGTTLAHYFFTKAKQAENTEVEEVKESEFRYPGPKPQTREAAIVMIADACEAATRSINDPTAAKIQTMVNMIITRRLLDGQFSECDLTMTDLKVIEDSITRTLVSLYHHRIEYPGNPKPDTTRNGNVVDMGPDAKRGHG